MTAQRHERQSVRASRPVHQVKEGCVEGCLSYVTTSHVWSWGGFSRGVCFSSVLGWAELPCS